MQNATTILEKLVSSIETFNGTQFATPATEEIAASPEYKNYVQSMNEAKEYLNSDVATAVKEVTRKAEKWDKLEEEIGEFYEGVDDEGNEVPPKKEGDLGAIGEVAAKAFGYL